jgi:uncharacterized protein YkwD
MGSILVVAVVVWLFFLALALAILRTAGQAERRLAAVLVAAPILASGAVGPQSADAAVCKYTRSGARMTAPSATLCLINRERTRRGLAPLVGNAKLGRAATRHASDMIRRGYFSHVTPEGIGFAARLRRAGYMHGCSSWSGGETLGWGLGSQASPAARVSGWMHSPPHRAIILGSSYREAGIAVLSGAPGQGSRGATYVGEFGRRRC